MTKPPLTLMRDTRLLGSREFDLIVIGGGIFGACAAWDAVLRGLSVALIEREDFCSGASADSFKMIHGGIRYIQHADIRRLRESCSERRAFLKVAPHLVHPLPIVIPTYGHLQKGRAFLAAGMTLYDLLTIDRNFGLADPDRRIPWSKYMDRSDTLEFFPDLPSDKLTGGAVFCDGQMYNPTRLVLAFVQSAASRGAVVSNYVEATGLIEKDGRVSGVAAVDQVTGYKFDIRGRVTLNAAGPWSEGILRKSLGAKTLEPGTYSRDACFVIPRKFDHRYALAIAGKTRDPDAVVGRDARHLFLVPWRNSTLVGVWHIVYDKDPDTVTVDDNDLQDFIDEINWAYPALDLSLDNVKFWNAGLVPFGENQPDSENLSYGKESRILDHLEESGLDGLVSLIGIRYTMGRGDAEKAIDIVLKKLGRKRLNSITASVPVWGGDIERIGTFLAEVRDERPFGLQDNQIEALVRNYGTGCRQVLQLAEEDTGLAQPFRDNTVLKAEIVNAIRHEMALTLSDIVFRRTDLAVDGNPGIDVLRECASIAAAEIGWDQSRQKQETDLVIKRFPQRSAARSRDT